uniref:Hypotheticial protein n=1 Tax=Schistosoma japonicum TaxID=6182 RepID=C1LK64_SCHJA|nr:hypotheticial protein [Schistosoma japonicum]
MYVKVVIVVTIIVICLNFICSARPRTGEDCSRPKRISFERLTHYYYDSNNKSCL